MKLITYFCAGHGDHGSYGTDATDNIVEWLKEANELRDAPYHIVYSCEITDEEAEYVKGYLA